jgi:transglutaminase-like putative cysteine protease
VRSYAGRDFVFAQIGDLDQNGLHSLPQQDAPAFEPIGRTDSEFAFCWIMNNLRATGARTLAGAGWEVIQDWFAKLCEFGQANFILADGIDIIAYRDLSGGIGLHWLRMTPPHPIERLVSLGVDIDLSNSRTMHRTLWIVSSVPMSDGPWESFEPGHMIVARKGAVRWTSHLQTVAAPIEYGEAAIPALARETALQENATIHIPDTRPIDLDEGVGKTLHVVHDTLYTYQQPVEGSSHIYRLRPVQDRYQDVIDFSISISVDGNAYEYEDVFGNQALQWETNAPYSELRLIAESTVRTHTPRGMLAAGKRWTVPPVWLPWQREMMAPYLLAPELPPTQLRELSDYAQSFSDRQDRDLVETLSDINKTLHRDYRYVSGSTQLETTAYDVYVHRQGVCQDFANLFICLARLLNVPARYRVGYLHLGTDYENSQQSEASHAWVEVFLPIVGWVGLDPTNGRAVQTDYVRTACGRYYRDATPTSGTLFRGGAGECLTVVVRVEDWTPQSVS